MVQARYEDFDHDYAERLATRKRPMGRGVLGVLSDRQNEVELQDSVMRLRSTLMDKGIQLSTGTNRSATTLTRVEFLDTMISFMGSTPGSLMGIWGATGPRDWMRFALVHRMRANQCETELFASMASFEDNRDEEYESLLNSTAYLLTLVAIHFEEASGKDGEAQKELLRRP